MGAGRLLANKSGLPDIETRLNPAFAEKVLQSIAANVANANSTDGSGC